MNGTKRDIDPASELLEEEEEQALPESDQDIDLAAAAGPLASAATATAAAIPASLERIVVLPSCARPAFRPSSCLASTARWPPLPRSASS